MLSRYVPLGVHRVIVVIYSLFQMAVSSNSAEFFANPTAPTSSSAARNIGEENDGDSVLMRASSFLNLHNSYPPLSQQASTSASLRDVENGGQGAGFGEAMRSRMVKVRSRLGNLFQRGEQRLRGIGGSGSGSNTLLVDNVDYGDAGDADYTLPTTNAPLHSGDNTPVGASVNSQPCSNQQPECYRVN